MMMEHTPLLEARSVSLTLPSGTRLLEPRDLALAEYERIAVRGRSGSGKSLMLRCLCLLEARMCGQLLFEGKPVADSAVPRYRSRVLYVSQKPVFSDGTVLENIRAVLGLDAHQGRVEPTARLAQWLGLLGRDTGFLSLQARHLSGGEAQIASVIRALALEPRVLCLDEPTSALDRESAALVEKLLHAAHSGAWIWVSHDPEQISRVASRVIDF